jgi:hypothetical protein
MKARFQKPDDVYPHGSLREQPEDPEDFNDEEDREFIRCHKCDGHDACEDFGCAHELGLGHLVKKNDWENR